MAVGPVDVYIIGFPGNKFSGRIAPAIMELVENGTIRILDLLFVTKDADGTVTTLAADDLDEDGAAFLEIDVTQPGALGDEDAEEVSDDLPANSSALLIAFENRWVGKVVDALRAADAVLIDSIRIPVDVVEAVRGQLAHPFEIERKTTWDFYAWQPAPPSSRAPPPPSPGACSAVRPRSTTSRTSRRTTSSRRSSASTRAAGRPRTTPRRSSRTWHSSTSRACSPTRSSRPPRPRSSGSERTGPRCSVRQVEAYSRLAGVYDEIVVDPCHGRWASFLHELWSRGPGRRPLRARLCCGTGLLAAELIALGYRVVGVDASEAMLALARERLGPGRGVEPDDPARPDDRRRLRRGGLHVRRPQLPRPGRAWVRRWPPWPTGFGPPGGSSSTCTPTR